MQHSANSKKVLLINLPKYDTVAPPGALAILAAVANQEGYDYDFLDLNILLHYMLNENEELDFHNWLTANILDYNGLDDNLEYKIKNFWQKKILEMDPDSYDYIGISVFSIWSLRSVQLILPWLRSYTNTKIVLGGNGITKWFLDTKIKFTDWIRENNFADFFVTGDGEPTFGAILRGETQYIAGVNGFPQVHDYSLDEFPIPDYSKFDHSLYSGKKLYITGSRGCVRKCTFCDIPSIWQKFRFRKAESLVDEIKHNFYNLGIKNYDFTDSLINGSVSNFYNFNCLLAEEKEKNPELEPIRYMGQFICRPMKHMRPQHYEAMHYAGCEQVTIGIESFSETVRNHMKKKFSDDDIEYHMEQSSYWNIRNVWLMISGYPTETLEDHKKNIKDLQKFSKYANRGILELIAWGPTMHLIDDTPIKSPEMMRELEVEVHNDVAGVQDAYDWVSKKNPDLTLKERIRRRLELHQESVKLGVPQPRARLTLNILLTIAEQMKHKNIA